MPIENENTIKLKSNLNANTNINALSNRRSRPIKDEKYEKNKNSYLPNRCKWMKYLDEEKYITQVTIPGSHDSAAFFKKKFLPNLIQTQIDTINYEELKINNLTELNEEKRISLLKRNFELQLRIGIRYFDIRIDFSKNVEPILTHGGVDLFIKLNDVIQIFKDFLNVFKSEFIIIKIKYNPFISILGVNDKMREKVKNIIENSSSENLLYNSSNLNIPKVKDVRGKIVVFDDNIFKSDNSLGFKTKKNSLVFAEKYSNYNHPIGKVEDSAQEMIDGIKDYLTKANNDLKANNQFYINSTNGTGSYWFTKTPLQFAQQIHPLIHHYLTSIQDKEGSYGIVVFDFVLGKLFSNEIAALLINSNYNTKKAIRRKLPLDEDYQENENPLKRKKSSDEDILRKSIKTSQMTPNYIQNRRTLPILKENNSIPIFERSVSTVNDEGRLFRSKGYIDSINQLSNYTEIIDISNIQKEHNI